MADPTQAGNYTVTATLDNPDYTATAVTGTLVIGQATPTITWAVPRAITAGTPLGAAQLDATASFDGVPLPGVLTYSPPAGTVLPAGSGQTLIVSFTPTDGDRFQGRHGLRPDRRPAPIGATTDTDTDPARHESSASSPSSGASSTSTANPSARRS